MPSCTPNFPVLEQRVAAPGWIVIRGDTVADAEAEAGLDAEVTWCLTRILAAFSGPQATMHGFKLEKYQGLETCPVVDGNGRVYAVFAGDEANPNFKAEVHGPAIEAMEEALRQCSASDAEDSHPCGTFYQEYAWQSHGGGQFVPGTL
ncbi:hypothetical protein B0H14DRAFT_2586251 [Mycena olivaceomarginata]|nr:hypothetical protein B0H14DRAFT_2586251 [Mycena olivaceomarginata]